MALELGGLEVIRWDNSFISKALEMSNLLLPLFHRFLIVT